MKDAFNPPISAMTSDELLDIVTEPKKWHPDAIKIAQSELDKRNVKPESIRQRKYIRQKERKIKSLRREKDSYNWTDILDFILFPFDKINELVFSAGLKKDGYKLKAKQRIHLLTILVALGLLIYYMVSTPIKQ